MKPSIYPNLAMAAYQALDAASSHRLSLLARSPAHLRHHLDHPAEPTPALVLGGAVHACCLEPECFESRYCEAPRVDRRTKDGKAEWGVFSALNADRVILDRDDWRACENMAHAVRTHPAARRLLESRTDTELSVVWDCRQTGVRCKARPDALADVEGMPVVIDLKTTENASRVEFERSIWKYAYHRQAAMYVAGMAAHGRIYEAFVIIAVEKAPPHAVACYRIQDDVLAIGHEEAVRLLGRYQECREKNVWPGYAEDVQEISIPAWALRQMEQEAA